MYVCDKTLNRISTRIPNTKKIERLGKYLDKEIHNSYYSPRITGARVLKRIRFDTRRLRQQTLKSEYFKGNTNYET